MGHRIPGKIPGLVSPCETPLHRSTFDPRSNGLRSLLGGRILKIMGTRSRERHYGTSVRIAAERAAAARKEADKLAVGAWNQRMLGFQGPAQPSPRLGDALNAGYRYLEVRCVGCDTHQLSRSTSCAGRRRRRSVSSSGTCDARTARRCEAMPTSAARPAVGPGVGRLPLWRRRHAMPRLQSLGWTDAAADAARLRRRRGC